VVKNVLILCTGNSARSILGEALINHLGQGRYRGYSAGSQPAGRVNPWALETLKRHGITLPEARSKSWDEFAQPGAPAMDYVFTVCDSAAAETCPYFPGDGLRAHWGIEDPATVADSDADKATAFELAYQRLHRRIQAFAALEPAAITPAVLARIGQMADPAT
jgi:arsenate reductase (thioredoxin)